MVPLPDQDGMRPISRYKSGFMQLGWNRGCITSIRPLWDGMLLLLKEDNPMILTLKGEKREFADGLSLLEIAGQISQALKKDALCARVDGTITEMWRTLEGEHEVEFLTFADDEAKRVLRHTASHVLGRGSQEAQAPGQARDRPRHR